MSLAPPRRIGPYPVRRLVAEGGMAWVFEVVDPRLSVPRALKLLKPHAAAPESLERFRDEANLLARTMHPNLVRIYDYGRDDESGCFYYTMTLVQGPNLLQRIAQPPRLGSAEVGAIFLDVLAGLEALHEQGIVHRDVKPSNVLLDPDGRAILSDLGVAHVVDSGRRTRTGTAIGTALYMSPEQARGRAVLPSSDVFSLGLCLYQALTARTVYDTVEALDSTSGQEVLLYLGSLVHARAQLRFCFPDDVPERLREVIRTACRFDPEERYADARAMRSALAAALDPRTSRPRLRRFGLAAGAAGALALALLTGTAWVRNSAERSALEADEAALAATHAGVAAAAAALADADRGAEPADALDLATALITRAREARLAGELGRARAGLEVARSELEDVCTGVLGPAFVARADRETARAATVAAELRDAGAPVDAREHVSKLAAQLATAAERVEAGRTCAALVEAAPTLTAAGESLRAARALALEERARPARPAPSPESDRRPEPAPTRPAAPSRPRAAAAPPAAPKAAAPTAAARPAQAAVAARPAQAAVAARPAAAPTAPPQPSAPAEPAAASVADVAAAPPARALENRAPVLTVLPAVPPRLKVGKRLTVEARAVDPDGDPVRVEYFLDGDKVGEGHLYTYRAYRRGTANLVVRATDSTGMHVQQVGMTLEVRGSPMKDR